MLSYFSRKRNSPQKSRTSTIKNMFSRALGSVRPSRARIHDVAIELSTPRSASPRSAAPSMKRHVPQEALDKLNTMRSESTALNTLTSKSINTQNEINKISRQIHLLKQKIIGAKKAEKDEYENTITNLEASKLALEKKLAEIKRNLRSVMGTIQNYSKKGGTRKRRKYAKKY
jgi:seryl-tRNA synthetase